MTYETETYFEIVARRIEQKLAMLGYCEAADAKDAVRLLKAIARPSEEKIEALYGPYLSPTADETRRKAYSEMIVATEQSLSA